jgi:hypothetical protein
MGRGASRNVRRGTLCSIRQAMLARIFPRQFDNAYRGHWLATWILALVALGRMAMGVNSIVNTRFVAMSADGIPLDSYGANAADAVVALFAIGGLFNVLMALQSGVVLTRYRAMIPFMFLLILISQIGSRVLLYLHPIVRSGVSTADLGFAFVLALFGLTVVGFVLSVLNTRKMQ